MLTKLDPVGSGLVFVDRVEPLAGAFFDLHRQQRSSPTPGAQRTSAEVVSHATPAPLPHPLIPLQGDRQVLTQSSAGQNAGLPSANLELVNYGAGYAWLRRELDVAIADTEQHDQDLTRGLGWPEPQPVPEERIALTDLGRRALAMERLFGSWPTLAQADAAEVSAA